MQDGTLETGHEAPVTDIAVDETGKRLATASEDGTIRLYEVPDEGSAPTSSNHSGTPPSWRHTVTLGGGEGSVSCIAWAPLVYYNAALVACTEGNRQVVLWSDFNNNGKQYERVYTATLPTAGWCVAWAPPEYGKLFAVGCADGTVTVFTGGPSPSTWDVHSFTAHHNGCCSIAFAPFFPPGALLMAPLEAEVAPDGPLPPPVPIAPPRMVTCGNSRHVLVWTHSFAPPVEEGAPPGSTWTPTELPSGIVGTWREVAWAPNVGLPFTYIAAGAEEGFAVVWSQDRASGEEWQCTVLPQHDGSVTKLSWSQAGTFLLVSYADGTAVMWKEVATSKWEIVSELENPSLL